MPNVRMSGNELTLLHKLYLKVLVVAQNAYAHISMIRHIVKAILLSAFLTLRMFICETDVFRRLSRTFLIWFKTIL